MASLYADECFPLPVVAELRRLGHDLLTTEEAGRARQKKSDADQLQFAISVRRAILTYNRNHFCWLHRQQPDHSGIIVCSQDSDFAELALRIDAEILQSGALDRKLIRVNRPQIP